MVVVKPMVTDELPKGHNSSNYARLHSAEDNTYQYEMTLSGLKADTKYYYAVYNEGEGLVSGKEYFFNHTLSKVLKILFIYGLLLLTLSRES